jgi:hypothetical protein
MRPKIVWISLIIVIIMVAGPVFAQDPIVYPAKGQSEDQMEKDKYQCYSWAKNQTGFDPMKTPTATSPPPQKEARRGGAGRGAVGGAAAGAIVGGITGGRSGAGKGALIGGGGGALIGGMRRENQRKQEEQARNQWEREQTNNYARARSEYNRAFGACMEGRGYSVK